MGLGSYRNFGFFTFLMPQRKDMVNLALSEWPIVLEQCTEFHYSKSQGYSKEIYFYTTFRVGCSHTICKDSKVHKKNLILTTCKKHFGLMTKWYLDISEIQHRSSRYLLSTESKMSINGGMNQVKTIQLIVHLVVW